MHDYAGRFRVAIIFALALSWGSAIAFASDQQRIDNEVDRVIDSIVELRHTIHEHPELGNREFKTAALVEEHLRALGFEATAS